MFKPLQRIEDLQPGDIVRHRIPGDISYIVTDAYGTRATAVRTVDITNPDEWEVLEKTHTLEESNG